MSFIFKYFNKESESITYQDIEQFFSVEKEESDKIEFKSYVVAGDDREKENGIIRTVCGFLNSSGGLAIWGSPVGQTVAGRSEKIFSGALSPVNKLIEKDYFINRITDSITPAPNGITFTRIENAGQYIYLLDVEQSEYSPHQFKNIYYMRIDGQTKPAPHHYIEALFKKISYPNLKGFLKIEALNNNGRNFFLQVSFIIFNMSKLQNEHNLFFRAVVSHGVIFHRSIATPREFGLSGHEYSKTEINNVVYYNQPYRYMEVLQIDTQEVSRRNSEFEISLFFGGKNSPLKLSKYKLRMDFTRPQIEDLNSLIIEINENRPFFEHSDSLGLSEEERLREILGR